jgi:hypothetical protein
MNLAIQLAPALRPAGSGVPVRQPCSTANRLPAWDEKVAVLEFSCDQGIERTVLQESGVAAWSLGAGGVRSVAGGQTPSR